MAPQQNSTFIGDDNGECHLRSPLRGHSNYKDDEEEEIIKRYSPIPKEMNFELNEFEKQDHNANKTHEMPKQMTNQTGLPKQLESDVQKKSRQNYYKKHNRNKNGNGNGNKNGNGNYASNNAQSCISRRSRSVSVYGANSTMGEEQYEITIWIDNEPRYVSGVTKKTICNDIVKALIDDEIQNGNNTVSKGTQCQHTYTKNGGDGVCATSRDYSDYVIAEIWRGVERSYDGNMAILPVWRAWSRVHNELRLILRHRSDVLDPIQYVRPRPRPSTFAKCLKKLARLWRKKKPDDRHGPSHTIKMKENCLLSNKAPIPDEFMFVIMPDKIYEKKATSQLQPIAEQPNANAMKPCKHARHSRCSMRSTRSKSRVNRRKHERGVSGVNGSNCIRRRHISFVSHAMRNSVRYRLAQKTSEMDELYAREYALTRELSEKCKLYRQQNQIYSHPDQQWNISIGQVQRKIESYAKEIVRTEHELLELKNEIKQDISLINNLKRMTLERGKDSEEGLRDTAPAIVKAAENRSLVAPRSPNHLEGNEQMQFVDNIYEFCDNNASMLV